MRRMDFDSFKPDEAWLKKSEELTKQLIEFHEQGKFDERNKFIDDNSAHWGKLKEELLRLSGNKCWFSETRDLYSHYDVEHFRPKKEAKELNGDDRDGYWWLAFDYQNYRICGNVGNRKKGGWFPLREGSDVATYEKPDLAREEYYLLDPKNAYDVTLIAFDEEGKAIPVPTITDDWQKKRVEYSIEKLKLNEHAPLADERRKVWQKLSKEIKDYYDAKRNCSYNNPGAIKDLKRACENIKEMTHKDSPLSTVAKWCIIFRNDMSLMSLL